MINSTLAAMVANTLHLDFDEKGKDIGSFLVGTGGYEKLNRLIRDFAFDIYLLDKHCAHLSAQGFQSTPENGNISRNSNGRAKVTA